MANTTNRNYPKPVSENYVSDDVLLLQAALDLVDGDIQLLFDGLSGKATIIHGHAIADVAGLQNALDGKAISAHVHALDDLTGVSGMAGAADGYLIVKTPTGWVPSSPAAALGAHGHVIGDVTNLQSALDDKASLASPAITGTPTAPTAIIATNTNQLATTAFVKSVLANDAVAKAGDEMTGALGVPLGSLAAPAIHISGDTDTGIYSPGPNQLDLSVGGIKAMGIDDAGIINLPNRPSCFVTSSLSVGVEPAGVVKFELIKHNIGSNYDALSGKFTAPVDGVYGVSTTGLSNLNTIIQRQIRLNGVVMVRLESSDTNTPSFQNVSAFLEVEMAAGDYVDVTNTQIQYGGIFSWFSVGMLG